MITTTVLLIIVTLSKDVSTPMSLATMDSHVLMTCATLSMDASLSLWSAHPIHQTLVLFIIVNPPMAHVTTVQWLAPLHSH